MTIITIDTETQGLNAQQFLMGTLCHENLQTETFNSKAAMWQRIMELAAWHHTNKKVLCVYAHNMLYDYYAIRPFPEPPEFQRYATTPFIADLRDGTGRIYCKFLCTTRLWRGSLASMGEAIGFPKQPIPTWLTKESYTPNFIELHDAARYMEEDARVLMRFLKELRSRLATEGITPRHLLTGAHLGVNAMLNAVVLHDNAHHFLSDMRIPTFHRTLYGEEVHLALRGGRNQAFHLGRHTGVTAFDLNSHYPHILATMRIPDLRTEQLLEEPLSHGWTATALFSLLGVSCAELTTAAHPFGVLPVRLDAHHTVYPRQGGCRLTGVWTHAELLAALERGYTLHTVHWSVVWEATTNPFTDHLHHLYAAKRRSPDGFGRYVYKLLLNGGIGKFAQRRTDDEYVWDTVEHHTSRLSEGWEVTDFREDQRLYKRTKGIHTPRWYAPILFALVTAEGRLRLLHHMETIPSPHLHYIDTDSLVGTTSILKPILQKRKLISSTTWGSYTAELTGTLHVWGPKTYALGDTLRVAGAPLPQNVAQAIDTAAFTYRRMHTEQTTPDPSLIGTFHTLHRDLTSTATATRRLEQHVTSQQHIVDSAYLQWRQKRHSKPSSSSFSAHSSSSSPGT